MYMPLLKVEVPNPHTPSKMVTVEFPGLTAFCSRQEGTPIERICGVIFGDFSRFVNRFGCRGGPKVADAIALYTALDIFDEHPNLLEDPTRLMRWSCQDLSAMICFRYWQLSQNKGDLLGLQNELAVLAPYRPR